MSSKSPHKGRKTSHIVGHTKTPSGREVWRIATGGEVRTSITSASSGEVMDRAVREYGEALERLAKR